MAETPKKSQGNPAAPRRVNARKLEEEQKQRLVVLISGAAIGLALLIVLGGLLYDQVWQPSRPVASVAETTLSRRDYWDVRRTALAREVVQNFQLLALFGGNPQFTQQFQGQSPAINSQARQIRSDPVNNGVVDEWESLQIKERGASAEGISVSQDEINQAIAQDLGQIFIPAPPPPDLATTAPAAAATAPEGAATGEPTTTTCTTEPAPSPTSGAPTATPASTATPEPTNTPVPTPAPAEAVTQVDQIIDEIFRRFEIELAAADDDPELTKDDFRAALNTQYREQVINRKVQEQLVPEAGFSYSTEPERIEARQVFIAVETPDGATQEQIDAAFADARQRADELAATLRDGADFAEVAAAQSDDAGSREQGGSLGSFDRDGVAENGATYPPELVAQAFVLEEGAISAPIRTSFGWHIIEVTRREVPAEDEQLRQARTDALDTWMEEQRAAISTARFPPLTATPTALPETPAPTSVPTFLPGPPTVPPTATAAPVEPTPTVTVTP